MNPKEQNLIYSPYPDVELPHSSITVTEMLWKRMEDWSDATAFVCGISGESYTYKQMKELSCNFAGSLLRSGVCRGDLIGFVSPPSPTAVIAVLGIWQAGCVFAPLNPLCTHDELSRDINKLGFKYIVSTTSIFEKLKSIRKDIPCLKHFILLDSSITADELENVWFYKDLIRVPTSSDDEIFSDTLNAARDVAVISSSSGSSGLPKSVMLTHNALCCTAKQYFSDDISNTKPCENKKEQEVTISVYPLSHVSGYVLLLICAMYQGMKVILVDKFQPKIFKELFLKYRPTFLMLVTPMIKCIAESPLFTSKELESLTTIVAGATPLTKCLIDEFMEKANKYICFQELYAATECLIVTSCNLSFKNSKLGSAGRLLPNMVVKLVDVETGRPLGPHKKGEILVTGPSVMKGYLNDEKATEEVFDEDGFYCTGDTAYYDEDGCFYIVDRKKDMIKVKGFQILPKEIELVIRTNSKVNDVCVVGVPHERLGEAPRAYIVKGDETLEAEEIQLLVKEKMAPFNQLDGGIEFVEDIPKVGVGKPLKRLLRDQYINNIYIHK